MIVTIDPADSPLWQAWLAIYMASFPAHERMSEGYLSEALSPRRAGLGPEARALGLIEDGDPQRLLAIAFDEFHPEVSAAYLGYLATRPDLRGRGHGETLYRAVRRRAEERGALALLLEVEIPALAETTAEREMAQRRIGWYQRLGTRRLGGVRHLQGVDTVEQRTEMYVLVDTLRALDAAQAFALAKSLFGGSITQIGPLVLEPPTP